jgi:hypothetical protein
MRRQAFGGTHYRTATVMAGRPQSADITASAIDIGLDLGVEVIL